MATTKTMAQTPSPTGLFWSERGEVACADHTPFEGSDTWIWQRWEPVPVEAIEETRRDARRSPLRCETCGKDPTR